VVHKSGSGQKVRAGIFDNYSRIISEIIEKQQGLYALYRKDKLHYVGLARNLKGRIKNHLNDHHKGKWTHFSLYIISHPEHTKELESLLLRIAYPAGNKVMGKLRRSANMLPSLKRKTKAAAIDEWKRIFERSSRRGKKAGKFRKLNNHLKKRTKGKYPAKGLVEKWTTIWAEYKGKKYRARLSPTGWIRFNGKGYPSPTAAAKKLVDTPTCNGWWLWQIKQGDKLIRLREMKNA